MNPRALRKALRQFFGDEHFRRLVGDLHHLRRLRFWQEEKLQQFATEHPQCPVDSESLRIALCICEIHDCELEWRPAAVFYGTPEQTTRYHRARRTNFPHAGIDESASSDEACNLHRWLCDRCLAAEAAWRAELKPWVTLSDIRARKERYPHAGIPIADLQQISQLIEETEEIADKRVMGMRLWSDGHVSVTTGEVRGPLFGGGNTILFRKEAGGWVVVEVSSWAS